MLNSMGVSEWLEVWMVAWLVIQLPMGMVLGRYLRQAAAFNLAAKSSEIATADRANGWQGLLASNAAPAR